MPSPNKQIKIAISGKAKSGKDTTSKLIVKAMNAKSGEYKINAFANPMKHIAEVMFPEANKECLYGASELRSELICDRYKSQSGAILSYRQFLIDLGAFGRQYNDDIWVNCLVQDVNRSKDVKLYIISDLRYCIEYDYLKNAGFYMVRVLRNDCEKINDSSELEQDKIPNEAFDTLLDNNSTIDDLYERVVSLVKVL